MEISIFQFVTRAKTVENGMNIWQGPHESGLKILKQNFRQFSNSGIQLALNTSPTDIFSSFPQTVSALSNMAEKMCKGKISLAENRRFYMDMPYTKLGISFEYAHLYGHGITVCLTPHNEIQFYGYIFIQHIYSHFNIAKVYIYICTCFILCFNWWCYVCSIYVCEIYYVCLVYILFI